MENNKTIPKIRFTGFTDAWEQRRLGAMGEFKSNGVDKKIDLNDKPVNLLNYMDVYNRRKITAYNCKNLMQVTAKDIQIKENDVRENDVFFTPSSETADDIGKVMVIEETLPNTVYSYHLMRFRPQKKTLYSIFPNYLLETNFVREQMRLSAQGVQRFVLNKDGFENLRVFVPSYAEQQQIGAFFKSLDHLITLHQRECDLLVKTKKSYLQKMFPKNGEDKPEIRFAGFTDAWEQRRLGAMGEFKSNGVDKKIDLNDKPFNLLNYMDVYNRRKITAYNCKNLMQVTAKDIQIKENDVRENDVFFTPSSETADDIGKVMVIEETLPNTVYSYHLMRFRPQKKTLYSIFPNYLLETNFVREQMRLSAQGVQRFVLNKDGFENLRVFVPSYAEQQQIGAFFKSLDHLITLHQRELNSLKNMKKSLLQQMFI